MTETPAYAPTWLDPDDVRHWLRSNKQPVPDEQTEVDRVCAAAEIHAQRNRPDQFTEPVDGTDPVYVPDAEVYQGAVMFAARELRRRNSPAGVESFADVGVSFVAKYDPDIDRALHTGAYTPPGVG